MTNALKQNTPSRDSSTPSVMTGDIVAALRSAGIAPGDMIMVHSSLKSFGYVDGGAEAVVDALLQTVDNDGTVIVPTLTASYTKGSSSGAPFHHRKTPSRVGVITEMLRRRPEAVRSLHPTHSVAAIGPNAQELMDGHWTEPGVPGPVSTFNIHGPYGKLVLAGAKIVFLGAPIIANTTLHAVEEWLDLPYMAEAEALIEKSDGEVETVKVTKAPLNHRDFYSEDGRIHAMLREAGAVTTVKLNQTEINVLPAKKMIRVTSESELEFPGVLLCERPECDFCKDGRSRIRTMQDDIRRNFQRLKEGGYTDIS